MITDEEINHIRKEAGREELEEIDYGVEDEDDIDVMSPKMDRLVTVGGVVVGIIALVIAAVVLTWVLSSNNIKLPRSAEQANEETVAPDKTIVPNVVGRTSDEAEVMLNDKHLGFEYDSNYVNSDLYPEDTIVTQSIEAGAVVDRNKTVKLVVSKGPKRLTVPSGMVNSNLDSAMEALDKLGVKTEVTYEYSEKEVGTVISCSPTERASISKTDTVHLKVSRGKDKTGEKVATVPNVVGYDQSKAQAKISSAGFSVGGVKEVYSDEVEKGKVVRQLIKGGSSAPMGASVSIVVSKGPEDGEKYQGTYTFVLEDLIDSDGNPITEGVVSVALNDVLQKVDPKYADVSMWQGDYTMNFEGDKKGKATIELFVDGKSVVKDTVKLK